MGDITTIGWTDKTHNEWIGCQKVTEEECGDCYAWRWAVRHKMEVWGSLSGSDRHLTKTHGNPRRWNREAQALGRRYKVFCASLSDVFEPTSPGARSAGTALAAHRGDTFVRLADFNQTPEIHPQSRTTVLVTTLACEGGRYNRVSRRSTGAGVSAHYSQVSEDTDMNQVYGFAES